MFSSTSIFVSLGLVACGVLARPAVFTPAARDVVAPPITYPTAGTVWTVGEETHVDWDVSSLPPYNHITNPKAMVILGYLDACSDSEHLDFDHPLADDFNITLGTIPVTVPNVVSRSDYVLVLFGDSGNLSPKFTINVAISGDGQAPPPIRAACTSSTTSSARESSTTAGTSSASSSVSTSVPDSATAASASSSVSSTSDTTIVIVPTATSTTTSLASTATSTATGNVSRSSSSGSASGSASGSKPAPSGSSTTTATSVRPLAQSQTSVADQSQSTNGAVAAAVSRIAAVLSGFAAAGFLLL